MNPYSITSNEVKMYKHLPELYDIQNGNPRPIQLHFSPTNKCNANCIHCCFADRDKSMSQDLEYCKSVIHSFVKLGIKSIEFTGGGEPTLYENINEIIDYCDSFGLPIGMNSNCIDITNMNRFDMLTWLRAAFNIFDSDNEKRIEKFKENMLSIKGKTKITACYIVPKEIGTKNLHKVIKYANDNEIHTRIAPDCIQDKNSIREMIEGVKEHLLMFENNKYCFVSDFNVYLWERKDKRCYSHYIKPFFYTDGYIYACPSSELSAENGRNMSEIFRICHGSEVEEYYNYKLHPKVYDCCYCKYTRQNEIMAAILTETDNNEFI